MHPGALLPVTTPALLSPRACGRCCPRERARTWPSRTSRCDVACTRACVCVRVRMRVCVHVHARTWPSRTPRCWGCMRVCACTCMCVRACMWAFAWAWRGGGLHARVHRTCSRPLLLSMPMHTQPCMHACPPRLLHSPPRCKSASTPSTASTSTARASYTSEPNGWCLGGWWQDQAVPQLKGSMACASLLQPKTSLLARRRAALYGR